MLASSAGPSGALSAKPKNLVLACMVEALPGLPDPAYMDE